MNILNVWILLKTYGSEVSVIYLLPHSFTKRETDLVLSGRHGWPEVETKSSQACKLSVLYCLFVWFM